MTPLLFSTARVALLTLWEASHASGDPERLFARIFKAYNHTGRHYHDLTHVLYVLRSLGRIRAVECPDDAPNLEQLWAVWLHDIDHDLFDPACVDRSAAVAFDVCRGLGGDINPDLVSRYVRATDHSKPCPDDPHYHAIRDADVSILGATSELYLQYVTQIEKEAAPLLVGPAFRVGRLNFINTWLAGGLFHTKAATDMWYMDAIRNMVHERAALVTRITSETP